MKYSQSTASANSHCLNNTLFFSLGNALKIITQIGPATNPKFFHSQHCIVLRSKLKIISTQFYL